MPELITQRNSLDLAGQTSAEREPSLDELQREDLPPLSDLIREYNAMVRERLKAQQEAELRFGNTMYCWSMRERRGEA